VTNGTASGKEDNLARYTEIFGNFSQGISVPFDFFPKFPKFSVEWSASEFSEVLDEWKAPRGFMFNVSLYFYGVLLLRPQYGHMFINLSGFHKVTLGTERGH